MSKKNIKRPTKNNKQRKPKRTQLLTADLRPYGETMPSDVIVTLRYADPTLTRMAAALQWGYFQLRINNLYDPDPLVGGGSVTGFVDWCGLYRKYRVLAAELVWEVSNLNTSPVSVYIYQGTDTVVPTTLDGTINLSENPRSTRVLTLAPQGGGRSTGTLRCRFNIGRSYGSTREYIANENFVGEGGSAPAGPGTNLFALLSAYSNTNLTNGIYSNLRVHYTVNFFDRYSVTA